jgi:hypothetical protein
MRFGAVPIGEAEGGVAVHSIRKDGIVLKKGTMIGRAEVEALKAAGISEIVVARMDPGDVSEDAAAAEIAAAVAGEGVRVDRAFTGRANLFADIAGILVVNKEAVDRLNRIDESITFATLPAYKPVVAGEMIATVKIMPRRQGHRQDLKDNCGPSRSCRGRGRRRAARRARDQGTREGHRGSAGGRSRARHRVRRLGDSRPAGCDSGRGRSNRRTDRAFGHAG